MAERFDTDVGLPKVPRNGFEAYDMIVASLSAEIERKTEILKELLDEGGKRQFVKLWHPGIKTVNIHVQ